MLEELCLAEAEEAGAVDEVVYYEGGERRVRAWIGVAEREFFSFFFSFFCSFFYYVLIRMRGGNSVDGRGAREDQGTVGNAYA